MYLDDDYTLDISKFALENELGEIVINPIIDLALICYVGKNYFINEEACEEELVKAIMRLSALGVSEEEMGRVKHLMEEFAMDEVRQEIMDGTVDPHVKVLEIMNRHYVPNK